MAVPEADLNRWCADLITHMDNMGIPKPDQLAIMHGTAAMVLPALRPKDRALAIMAHTSAMLIAAGKAVDGMAND